MASIVAYIELRQGAITRPSRFAVAEARRVASSAGATVYALLAVGTLTQAEIDQLASEVSAAGADRVLCSSAELLAGAPLDVTHGAFLAQVAERLRPVLFLFPAGGTGGELGPPLAVRIGASYLANASIEVVAEERGPNVVSERVVLTRWRAARDGLRRVDVGDLERPVVASLACGSAAAALGEPYTEVEMLPCPEPGPASPRLLGCDVDKAASLEVCSAVLWSAHQLDPATRAALPADLPAGVAMVVASEAGASAIEAASPGELFIVSTNAVDAQPLAHLAPGATVTRVRVGGPS